MRMQSAGPGSITQTLGETLRSARHQGAAQNRSPAMRADLEIVQRPYSRSAHAAALKMAVMSDPQLPFQQQPARGELFSFCPAMTYTSLP